MIPEVTPDFLSISKRSLSTETKAISIPEKKAEKAMVINKKNNGIHFINLWYQSASCLLRQSPRQHRRYPPACESCKQSSADWIQSHVP